jgi:class 3 adenylate cyclase
MPNFLKTILLAVILLSESYVNAQQNSLTEMEASLSNVFGSARVEILLQIADEYAKQGKLEKAESKAEDAADYARKIKNNDLRALSLNRIGKIMQMGGKKKAFSKFEQSFNLLIDTKSKNAALLADNLENLRKIAQKTGRLDEMPEFETRMKSSTASTGGAILNQELSAIQKKLAETRSNFNENESKLLAESKALQQQLAEREAEIDRMSQEQMKTAMLLMQQRFLLDSITFKTGMDSLAVSNANLALREAESSRKFHYSVIGVLFLLAAGSLFSFFKAKQNAKVLEEKNKIIKEEQERSENLLLNILPSLVAQELKETGRTQAQFYEDVSVLFADFVGFSKIAEKLTPQQLVTELDTCFQKFDDIIARHDLEKIKTVGDSYMCAGGVPNGGGAKLGSMVSAAFEMQNWLAVWNNDREKKGQPRFDARIGIHRGPVVAGVVGSKKFAFDIWGDTVNVAARIEQAGEGGKVNISGDAYQIVKDTFRCHYRGKIHAKNKGEIDMYFVEI